MAMTASRDVSKRGSNVIQSTEISDLNVCVNKKKNFPVLPSQPTSFTPSQYQVMPPIEAAPLLNRDSAMSTCLTQSSTVEGDTTKLQTKHFI